MEVINFPNPNQNDIIGNDIYYQNNLNVNYPINRILEKFAELVFVLRKDLRFASSFKRNSLAFS